jgi:long-chain acyl-CoA synthetase
MTATHQLQGHDGAAETPAGNSPITEFFSSGSTRVKLSKALMEGEGFRLSYRDLFEQTCRLGTLFEERGLTLGDRAVIISDHDPSIISLFFALIRHGITATMLNPHGSDSELETLCNAADPAVIFVDAEVARSLPCLQERPDAITIDPQAGSRGRGLFRLKKARDTGTDSFPALLTRYAPATDLPVFIPEDTPAYILFTSGTTSQPKGVVITHKSLFAQMDTFVNQYRLSEDTRLLNVLPFYHTDGLTQGAVVSFVAGGTLLRPMRFRVERLTELLDGIYKLRVSHFVTVPSMLALIDQISADLQDAFHTHEFEFIISTAAYLDESLWRRFETTFGVRVVNVYGLTETVCEACYCGPEDSAFRYGTVGRPVDCEARVVADDGSLMASGGPGELVLKGDNIMAGYFRMPEATAEVLRDGWFHTGDVAEIDADGFVRIVGRKKSVIISGGYNIYPEDVTNVIRRMPEVLDAVSFGLPDATWGEKVVACVIPKDGVELSESALATHFLAEASREKLPREFHLMSEFPRGPAGKVVLETLKQQVLDATEALISPTNDDASWQERFLELTARAFKVDVDAVTLEATPEQIESWDSLAHVEWLMALEKAYAIRFDPKDIMTIRSVGQALSVLEGKQH